MTADLQRPEQRPLREVWIIVALWMVSFAMSAQFLIVAPILPRIGEQLQVDSAGLGILITAYGAGMGCMALLAGPLSDHLGRRTVLVWGSAGMAGALALHGLPTSLEGLVAARTLAGIMSGVLAGSSIAYLGDVFPYHRRGMANGWVGSGLAAGQILGIPAGTLLAEHSFRTPFLAFALLMALAFLLVWRVLPTPRVKLSEHLSVSSTWAGYRALLVRPDTLGSVACYVLMLFSVGMFVTYFPAWLEQRFQVGAVEVASLFLVGGLANLVAAPLAGKVSDRIGRKAIIAGSTALLALMMGVTTWALLVFSVAYLQFFLVMTLVGLRMAPMQALVTALVPARQRGTLLSLGMAMGQLGFALGGALAGPVYVAWDFSGNAVIAGLASLLMAWVVVRRLPEPKGDQVEAA